MNLGLELDVVTDYGKTPLTIAASKGLVDICIALLQEVDQTCSASLHHKDGNKREALEYAKLYNQSQTYTSLTKLSSNTSEREQDIHAINRRYIQI